MVKTEWRAIKAEGADKAYTEIDDPSGTSSTAICTSWPMVSMVWCWCTALTRPASNAQIDDKDADGKAFVEVRVELSSGSQASGSPTNS